MKYQWDSLLETGNENIDSQHKQLVAALNALIEACSAGTGKAELARTMEFLVTYTKKHFNDEEELQIRYGYDDYLRHRQIHRDFSVVIAGLAVRLQEEGPTASLLAEVRSKMGDWFINHIKGDDFYLAAFIKSQEERTGSGA
jgi:hemerythrin-like metal-binding domain